ncbi:MAG: Hsp20/alpha crystallin family protein [Patescibacteria group bacterium]
MPINILLKKKADDSSEMLFPEHELRTPGDRWMIEHEEGQLAVDVFETDDEIVLRSAIAGVSQDDLEVFLHNDMLTVRGVRQPDEEPEMHYLVRECHWGSFSRSVILPGDINPDGITAVLKDGVLRVGLPKIERSRHIKIKQID